MSCQQSSRRPPHKRHVNVVVKPQLESDVLSPLVDLRKKVLTGKSYGPPSVAGKPPKFKALQDDPAQYLACTRPPKREPCLPVTLLDRVFAAFVDNCQSVKITEEAYECARQLKMQMNEFYDIKLMRVEVLREILETFDIVFQYRLIKGTPMSTDGHILCGSQAIVILDVKDEIGSLDTEPSLQAFLNYYNIIKLDDLWKDTSSIRSCFIVTLAGTQLAFAGCILTDRPTMETLASVFIDFHDSNKDAYRTFARHLTAFKIAVDTLSDRHSKVDPTVKPSLDFAIRPCSAQDLSRHIYRIFPYPTTFTSCSTKELLSFTYNAELEKKSFFFKGHTTGQTIPGQPICVKFVREYGRDVHGWCANQGFAPELLGFEALPGGWSMVIMELLDELWIPLSNITDRGKWKDNIEADILSLHKQHMVNGDIRSAKIMVNVKKAKHMLVESVNSAWLRLRLFRTYYCRVSIC